jgi:hypothetical protein
MTGRGRASLMATCLGDLFFHDVAASCPVWIDVERRIRG